MKNKNDDNEVVTRGILRETLVEMLDEFATRIGTTIENNVVARISAKIDEKIGTAIGDLAVMTGKGFASVTKDLSLLMARVDVMSSESKEVHKEVKVNHLKTRGDIASIDFRVGKLEKSIQS